MTTGTSIGPAPSHQSTVAAGCLPTVSSTEPGDVTLPFLWPFSNKKVMQRVRRDSASSTDSWSIIEQRCSPEVREEEDLSAEEESDLDTDGEIEIGEEAFDSHDSDIEVDDRSIHDEEEEEEEEIEEEVQNEESEEEEEDQKDWDVFSEKEAMKGEGKHFVAPERIRGRLDSINRNKDSNRRLFLKASLGCFLAQNAVLLGLLLFSKPISNPHQQQNQQQKTSPSDYVVFEWNPFNASSLQRCWSKTRVSFNLPSTTRSPPPSWTNFTLPSKEVYTFPSLTKVLQPTVYRPTTISRRSKTEKTCLRTERPPTVPKSLFPCQQTSSAPFDAVSSLQTLPEKYNLSALENIIQKKNEMIEKVWKRNSIFSGKREMSSAFEKKIGEPLKTPCFPKKIAPTKTEMKPRGRTFNYKMELIPVKKTKNILKFTPIKEVKKSYWLPRREILRLQQQMKKKNKNALSVSQKAMSVYDSRRKKMNKKYTNFRMAKNSSNSAKKQCARRDFKRLQLEGKSQKRRQRLLEYKIEKPCRAIFVKNTKERKTEEKKMEKKKWQKNVTKNHGRRLKKSFSL